MGLKRKTPLRRTKLEKKCPTKKTLEDLVGKGLVKKASTLSKRRPTGEKEIFRRIWESRRHACEICGVVIKEARAANFAHVLPKGSYPELQLDERNIMLMCCSLGSHVGCHDRQHYYGDSLRTSYKWNKFFKIKDQLREGRG